MLTGRYKGDESLLDIRLPHTPKEGLLYGTIICSLTVIAMSTISTLLNTNSIDLQTLLRIGKIIPIIWLIAMVIEPVIIGRLAEKVVALLTHPSDSFYAKIVLRIFFTVLGMSFIMTCLGETLFNGLHTATLQHALTIWPRNFMIVLVLESFIIQPIARAVMVQIHKNL